MERFTLIFYRRQNRLCWVGSRLKKNQSKKSKNSFFKNFALFFFLTETLNPHIIKGIYYFLKLIYFWRRWVFVSAHGLSLVAESGGYSSLQCAGFSLQWLLLLWSTGSRCAGFSSCGTQAQ